MKYLDIEIRCNQILDRFSVSVKIKRMHRDAGNVWLKLNLKVSGQYFEIEGSFNEFPRLNPEKLRLPNITEFNKNGNPIEDIPENVNTSNDCTLFRYNIHTFFYRLLMALYHWDKRCSRSVNVKGKLKEDMPVKIIWNEKEFNLSLEQMVTFAEFIKQ